MKQPKFHDALILKGSDLIRFPHATNSQAFSDKPSKVDPLDLRVEEQGYRKVKNLLESQDSYMTVATLPLREEPEASAFSCFAFNPTRLPAIAGGQDLTVVTELDPESPTGNAISYQFEFAGAQPDAYKTPTSGPAVAHIAAFGDGTQFRMAIGRLPRAKGAGTSTLVFNAPRLSFHNPWTQEPLFSAKANAVPVTIRLPAQQLLVRAHGTCQMLTLESNPPALLTPATEPLLGNAQAALERGTLLGDVENGGETVQLVDLDGLGVTEPRVVFATDPGVLWDVDVSLGTIKALTPDDPDYVEIWSLLRNGCIVGGAKHGDNTKVPVINLSAFSGTRANRQATDRRFAGTHDFKWKPGTKLRYVVQRPQEMSVPEFSSIVNTIETVANRWTATGANIVVRQVPEEAVKGPEDYDIWIDLSPLPMTVNGETVELTGSSLGRYARRRGYRVPTMYLGLIKGFKDPQSPKGALLTQAGYWKSPVFEHTILHEFGHALGLPHLHQYSGVRQELTNRTGNPDVFVNDSAQIQVAIKQDLGIDIPTRVIDDELLSELEVEDAFSDWPDAATLSTTSSAPAVELADKSVMIGLGNRSILTGFRNGHPNVNFETKPGAIDIAWILKLYPPLQVPGNTGQTQDPVNPA